MGAAGVMFSAGMDSGIGHGKMDMSAPLGGQVLTQGNDTGRERSSSMEAIRRMFTKCIPEGLKRGPRKGEEGGEEQHPMSLGSAARDEPLMLDQRTEEEVI